MDKISGPLYEVVCKCLHNNWLDGEFSLGKSSDGLFAGIRKGQMLAKAWHRPDDGGSTDLWNVGKLIPVYTALQPKRQPSSRWIYFHILEGQRICSLTSWLINTYIPFNEIKYQGWIRSVISMKRSLFSLSHTFTCSSPYTMTLVDVGRKLCKIMCFSTEPLELVDDRNLARVCITDARKSPLCIQPADQVFNKLWFASLLRSVPRIFGSLMGLYSNHVHRLLTNNCLEMLVAFTSSSY
jgi:hypothetical protein